MNNGNDQNNIDLEIKKWFVSVFSDKKKKLTFILVCLFIVAIILSAIIYISTFLKSSDNIPASITETPSQPPVSAEPTSTPTPTEKPTPESTEEPTPEPTEDLTGLAINVLTGEMIDEEAAKRRPFAFVINNVKIAWPQSGIGQADMFYEVLAEGDVTRIIALFQEFDAPKIGTIRSARPYFFQFAYDHDAIFIHHGASTDAYRYIRGGKIDNMDGQDLDGSMFWRDAERRRTKGLEHSSYTNAENAIAQVESYNYRKDKADGYTGIFEFYKESESPKSGLSCDKATVSFIASNRVTYTYDKESNVYYREQYGQPQLDIETGEQLSVTNVIVQFANMRVIDNVGRRSVDLVSSGDGYLLTNGVYVPIKWQKTSELSPTVWTFDDGTPLTVNKGKTWVCVVAPSLEPIFETLN